MVKDWKDRGFTQKDKARCKAEANLKERRKERDEFDRQAQAEASKRAEVDAEEEKEEDEEEVSTLDKKAASVELKTELKAERAKVDRLEREIAASREEQRQLKEQLKGFRAVVDGDSSSSAFRDTLDVDGLCLALALSDKKTQTQTEELKKASETVLELEGRLKTLKEETEVLREKGRTSLGAAKEQELKEAKEKLESSQQVIERIETKLVKAEAERDDFQGVLKSTKIKIAQLEGEKKDLQAKIAQLVADISTAKNSRPAKSQEVLDLETSLASSLKKASELTAKIAKLEQVPDGDHEKKVTAVLAQHEVVIKELETEIAQMESEIQHLRVTGKSHGPYYLELQAKLIMLSSEKVTIKERVGQLAKDQTTNNASPSSDRSPNSAKESDGTSNKNAGDILVENDKLRDEIEKVKVQLAETLRETEEIVKQRESRAQSSKEAIDRLENTLSEMGTNNSRAPSEHAESSTEAQKKAEKSLIQKLATELSQSHKTITQLRNENTSLLLQITGVE